MSELFLSFAIITAVLGISVILFGGWVFFLVAVGIRRAIGALFAKAQNGGGGAQRMCGECRQFNPQPARYCRRCGHRLNSYRAT